jgi:hypothetical protein
MAALFVGVDFFDQPFLLDKHGCVACAYPPPWSVEIGNTPASKGLGALRGCGVFMRTNRTPDEWDKWCRARVRIDDELKDYYVACATGELPPQLIALSQKLDQELLKKQDHQ